MYDLDRKMPVDSELRFLLEKDEAITNKTCSAHLVFSALGILCFLYKGYTGLAFITVLFIVGYVVTLYLKNRKFYILSKIWLIVLSYLTVYFYALQLGAGSGIQYAFFILFFLPFLLFSADQKWYIGSSLLFGIFLFFSFYYKLFDVTPIIAPQEQKGLYPSVTLFIFMMFGEYYILARDKSNTEEMWLKQGVAKLDEEIKNIKFESGLKGAQASSANVTASANIGNETGRKETKIYNEKLLATTEQELINPLLKIASVIDSLPDKNIDKEQTEAIKMLRDKTYDIKTVLNDFSFYAKIKESGITLHLSEFSLQETVIRTAQKCNNPEMRKKGVTVEAQFNPELPVLVKGDRERFEEVLSRLVIDAIKRTEEGKVIIYVTLEHATLGEEHPFVILTVEDPGLYLPESKRELINLAFQKKGFGDIETDDELGLGLSIVKYLVDMQGGGVSIENEGAGNKLLIRMPYEIVAKRNTDKTLADGKSSIMKFTNPLRILIAEDNPVNQKMFGTLLTKWGGSATTVSNGAEVIELLKKGSNFDLILMDIHMDRMDGIECSRIIRNELPEPIRNIPIIAVSSEIGTDKRNYYRQLGMNDYLPKPFTSTNLFNTIISNLPSKPTTIIAPIIDITNNSYWAVYKNAGEPKQYVNLKNLQDLAEGDDSFIDEILNSIFDSVPRDLVQMKHAIETGNWEGVKQLSYKIKSTVILTGAEELEGKIYAIQMASENPDEYLAIPFLYNQAASLARLSLKEINRFFNEDSIELIKGNALTQAPPQLIKRTMESAKTNSMQAGSTNVILPLKKRTTTKAKDTKSKILLVEDNMAVMKILSNKLEKDGYIIDSANDGKQAIDKLSNGSYDLVLTDLMLPFVNGLEIVNHVREKLKQDIPVIILTSVELEETVVEAFKIGVTDVLFKPFSPSELSARIKKHLQ